MSDENETKGQAEDEAKVSEETKAKSSRKSSSKSEEPAPEATTKDGTDAGVDMLPGDASEPVGPEDAFGEGQKRGDYSGRVSGAHAESVPLEGGGEPILDDDGNVVDLKPKSKLVSQTERAGDQGEVPGEKGGVTTAA